MTRPTVTGDYVQGQGLDNETVVRVSQGTTLAHTEWACITQGGITVGTTAITLGNTVTGSSSLLSLSPGVNVDVAVAGNCGAVSLSAAGAFAIAGLTGGWDGREVTIINPTGSTMIIKHQDSTDETVPGNRIICSTGADLVLPAPSGGFSWCTLRYCTLLPGPSARWLAMDSSTPSPPLPWQFLPQLVLSLRSDIGVSVSSGTVTDWADQSGAGNSVSVGGAASSGPTYLETGGPAGLPILCGFSFAAFLNNVSNNIVPSGADRTVIFVGQVGSVGGEFFTFRRGTAGLTQTVSCFAYLALGGSNYCWTDAVNGGSNETIPTFVTTPVIIIAIYHLGSLLGIRVNGAPVTVSSGGGTLTAETGPTGFSVGVNEAFTSPAWDGYILEQHVCAVQLTVAQCQQFEGYASARYGIGI